MAAEARAMLDALMGSDRNAEIPKSGSNNLQRKKKSCYDHDICPLHCAWGVDVFELFTNTKSDLGPNPCIVQEDAREEFLTLPDHEKDRLGYEFMLYRKLNDMVRGCDRIVNRNKEKLRMEIAKAAKERGRAGRSVDPASDVSEEMVLEAAEIMADLELREEEVAEMLGRLMDLDREWKEVWEELKCVNGKTSDDEEGKEEEKKDQSEMSKDVVDHGKNKIDDGKVKKSDLDDSSKTKLDDEKKEEQGETVDAKENNINEDTGGKEQDQDNGNNTDSQAKDDEQKKDDKETLLKELKSKLYKLSAEQQKLISSISILTSQTIVPLRDNLQNLNKQLYYVKTDTSSDKTVCEVSGNFMSSRDAEERIAAHYAGKQYVGWRMVREKLRSLHKKYAHGPPRGGGGPPPGYGGRGGGYGSGGPPPGYGYGGRGGGGYGRGPPGGYGHGGPPPPGYGGPPPHLNNRHRRDRSRSRDRGDGPSRSRHHRRRSPSPPRWKRDRGYGGRR